MRVPRTLSHPHPFLTMSQVARENLEIQEEDDDKEEMEGEAEEVDDGQEGEDEKIVRGD